MLPSDSIVALLNTSQPLARKKCFPFWLTSFQFNILVVVSDDIEFVLSSIEAYNHKKSSKQMSHLLLQTWANWCESTAAILGDWFLLLIFLTVIISQAYKLSYNLWSLAFFHSLLAFSFTVHCMRRTIRSFNSFFRKFIEKTSCICLFLTPNLLYRFLLSSLSYISNLFQQKHEWIHCFYETQVVNCRYKNQWQMQANQMKCLFLSIIAHRMVQDH